MAWHELELDRKPFKGELIFRVIFFFWLTDDKIFMLGCHRRIDILSEHLLSVTLAFLGRVDARGTQ